MPLSYFLFSSIHETRPNVVVDCVKTLNGIPQPKVNNLKATYFNFISSHWASNAFLLSFCAGSRAGCLHLICTNSLISLMGKMGLKMNLTCPVRQIKLLLLSHGSPEVACQVDQHDNAKHWWPPIAFGFKWSLIINYFNILTSIQCSLG
jgi:hypothetical protein